MALALLAAVAVAAATLILGWLHLQPTGLHWRSDAVSDYGTTTVHAGYRAMVVLFGAGGILLAIALDRNTAAAGIGWLWAYGASRVAIAGFMTDRDLPPSTREGRIHWLLAATAFTSIAIAGSKIGWSGAPAILSAVGHIVAATAVATLVTRLLSPLRPLFGAAERLLYLSSIVWLLIAALALV